MPLYSNAWHILGAALVLLLGALVAIGLAGTFGATRRRALGLYLWHTAFCLVYLAYVLRDGGDALGYYRNSLAHELPLELGTAAVNLLTSLFSRGAGLSLLGTFLVFNIFGSIGLLAYDAALRDAVRDKTPRMHLVATLIVLLPSASFWSAAIGKDAISFMAAGLALYAALDLRHRGVLMAVAIVAMVVVRPHIAAIMVTALALAMLRSPDVSFFKRLVLGAGALAGCVALVPLALSTAGLGVEADFLELGNYIESRQQQNLQGGGAVDISRMSLPMKLFTYLFRPMLFEAHNLPALAAAVDNLVLLVLSVGGAAAMLRRDATPPSAANRAFLWIYVVASWLILAMTTANLGISVRQKWMFVPMLVYLLLSLMGTRAALAPSATASRGWRDGW